MTQRNHVIAIIIIVLFVVLAAISFGIYKLVHGARRELTVTSSASSSYISGTTSNEVPEDYLITSTSSLPPPSTQTLPFPPRNQSSSMPTTKIFPWNQQQQQQQHSPSQPTPGPSSSSTKVNDDNQPSSSSARLLHEQRLSTCLNILRHIQRTLRHRHDEATAHLAQLSALVARSTWDLFYRSPLDFMCHEMDMLADDTTDAILSDESPVGIGSSGSSGKLSSTSDAWMKKLDELRDLRDDEDEARRRVDGIARQMEVASGMMRVGVAEQSAVLARGDALVRGYRYLYSRGGGRSLMMPLPMPPQGSASRGVGLEAKDASSRAMDCAPRKSGFFDWPVPDALSKGKQVAVESEEESSELDSPRECQGPCCRYLTS
ncbi:hypothetical protein V8C44DRAFT_369034 [Trichoderma aethiopicum]